MTGRYSGTRPQVPQFCSGASLLLLLLLSLGLALVIVLAGLRQADLLVAEFGKVSFFILWISLTSAALLCTGQRWVKRLPNWWTGVVGFTAVQLVTLFYSLLVISGPAWLVSLSELAMEVPSLFVVRNLAISLLASFMIFRHWALMNLWRLQIAAESRARLEALQARIRPHFLFNTLNTISSLIPDQPDQAEQATMDLADLLRTGLKEEASHLLADELALVRGYLRIEGLRLGERLQVEWLLDDALPLDTPMPALLLQPLVENAVIHGIAARPDGGKLVIRGQLARFGRLRFVVENPLAADDAPDHVGNQLALDNIRQRLALAYEQGAGLKTERADGLFRVTLVIPVDG